MSRKPEIILFDWDGTLVDSFAFIEAAHDYALSELNMLSRPQKWFEEYFGKQRDFIYSDIYGDKAPQACELFEEFVQKNHKKLLDVMAGAEDVLKQIQGLGITMGVVSNKRGIFIHAEVEHLGWGTYFSCVIGSGDAKEDKPSAQPIYEALGRAGFDRDIKDVLYIGDTIADMKTSQNASCPWIFVNPNVAQPDWALNYPPLKTVKDCRELGNYLLQYQQK